MALVFNGIYTFKYNGGKNFAFMKFTDDTSTTPGSVINYPAPITPESSIWACRWPGSDLHKMDAFTTDSPQLTLTPDSRNRVVISGYSSFTWGVNQTSEAVNIVCAIDLTTLDRVVLGSLAVGLDSARAAGMTNPTNDTAGFISIENLSSVNIIANGWEIVGNVQSVKDLIRQSTPFLAPSDPYEPGGESDTGGGTGNFDGTSVDVDFATLPTLSAVDTGFITLYNPSLSQLQSLANYMWSNLFDLDTFKKLFADPMQAILGLSIVPGPVPNGGTQAVKVGNISTGVSMTKAATQYIDIDCGTLNVEEYWGAYLDYEPYTKAEIFLPFIGVHQIAIDDIMNKPVHIKYHIDLLSGGCACEIKCGGSVLYTFIGSCAVSIPITGNDWTNVINGVISIASSIGTMVASGGASAPSSVASIASAAVNNLKPSVEKSGSVSGAGGLLAGKVPVLILTRPRQALPGKQNTFTGYPAFITRSLGALSGYTEVHSIRLSGIDGTESEIDEIEELLKGGVIL